MEVDADGRSPSFESPLIPRGNILSAEAPPSGIHVFINWLTEARDAPPRPSDRMTGSVMDGFRPFDDLFAWTDRGPLWIMCPCFCRARGPDLTNSLAGGWPSTCSSPNVASGLN